MKPWYIKRTLKNRDQGQTDHILTPGANPATLLCGAKYFGLGGAYEEPQGTICEQCRRAWNRRQGPSA